MTKPVNGTSSTHSSGTKKQPQKKKVDQQTQSVFNEINKNNKQAMQEHDQFMQDMFGDVLSGNKKAQGSTSSQQTQQHQPPKKKVDKKTQKAHNEIEKNNKKAMQEHDQFMQDMFGDVL